MNIPTKLTVTRLFLTPVLLVVFFLPQWISAIGNISDNVLSLLNVISGVLIIIFYIICELTDFLDGYIARKYNMITDVGKVLDPFSDVMIHITCFLCFTFLGIMPLWAFVVIMYREFAINMVRMLAIEKGVVIPANGWGKSKTVLYAITGIMGIVYVFFNRVFAEKCSTSIDRWALPLLYGAFSLAAVAAFVSFLTYVIPFVKAQKKQ